MEKKKGGWSHSRAFPGNDQDHNNHFCLKEGAGREGREAGAQKQEVGGDGERIRVLITLKKKF